MNLKNNGVKAELPNGSTAAPQHFLVTKTNFEL
jgi:hypothetical protein